MQQFGGNWTEDKMEIVVSYAKAYLTIMNKQDWAKTLYFDGFAGSGQVGVNEKDEAIKGTALRILEITEPEPFDIYYFVEKDIKNKTALELKIKTDYPESKNAFVVQEDCNVKLKDMAEFLKKKKTYCALAFIDPYGMTVDWASIELLKELRIDLWILVPTGVGVNRLLKKDGDINQSWVSKLEKFLGISGDEIKAHFYEKVTVNTLFGEETLINKEKSTITKIGKLYSARLNTVFKFVSEPFVMRNRMNSIMYHFIMATNNATALTIANDVIKPKYKL